MVLAIILSGLWIVLFAPLACLPLLLPSTDPALEVGGAAPVVWDEPPAPRDAPATGSVQTDGWDERHEAA